jgi:hypothetical protein
MFAREKRINGYTCLYLVETVREDGRTKQRIIRNLGRKEAVLASGALDRLATSVGHFAERAVVLQAIERGEAWSDAEQAHATPFALRCVTRRPHSGRKSWRSHRIRSSICSTSARKEQKTRPRMATSEEEDRAVVEGGLGCAEQCLDLQQVAVAQHGLQRGHAGVGAPHQDAVVACLLGERLPASISKAGAPSVGHSEAQGRRVRLQGRPTAPSASDRAAPAPQNATAREAP